MPYLKMFLALVVMILGADWLVRGATRLAGRFGVSRLLIGLTVVAFGTSAPELAVSLRSALGGQPDLTVGNVLGSNVFNVLMVLGLTALARPLVIARKLIRLDIPIVVAVSLLLFVLALDGHLSRFDGLLLFAGGIAYTVFSVRLARREAPDDRPPALGKGGPALDAGLVLVGLFLLVVGADGFVNGAVELARAMGVSELVIGLTIVAAGTSLPEVMTSVVAALRDERDMAVGNVVGSNLMNILCILGASSLIAPDGVAVAEEARAFDLPVMIASAFALLPIAIARGRLARWEGAFFLGSYAAYTLFLLLQANQGELLPAYRSAMLGFVLPLVSVTLIVVLVQGLQRRHEGGP